MKKILALSLVLSSAVLSGCACLGIGESGSAAAGAGASSSVAGQKTSIELDIKFETGKDEIAPLYDHQLMKVSEFMRMHPESDADVEGYADVTGEAAYNKALSQRRSDAVRTALITRFGCDGTRLTTTGYGERPLIGTGSVAERAANRRVLATFTGRKKS